MKNAICLFFFLALTVKLFGQIDSSNNPNTYFLETTVSVLTITTKSDYNEFDLFGLSRCFFSAELGIRKNKSKYYLGVIFRPDMTRYYNLKSIGGVLRYKYNAFSNRRGVIFFAAATSFISSSASLSIITTSPSLSPNGIDVCLTQKTNSVVFSLGSGIHTDIWRNVKGGCAFEMGMGIFSLNASKEVPDFPQESTYYDSPMFSNNFISIGARLFLNYTFD